MPPAALIQPEANVLNSTTRVDSGIGAFRTCDDDGMPKWVRSYWDEEDVTSVWEVGDDGWVTRHVELVGPALRPTTAAALDEWMRELDAGRIQAYQARYGVLAEKPIIDWRFPQEDITEAQFDQVWAESRRALEATR